jgi:uncharacterized alpha-E superfamily protein
MNEAHDILQRMAGDMANEAVRLAGELHAALHYGRIDMIFAGGLHEYLTDFLRRTDALGQEVNRTFFSTDGLPASV